MFHQIGSHIKKQVGELGFSCTGLVTKAGALQCSPNDTFTKKELIESARKVSEKVHAHSQRRREMSPIRGWMVTCLLAGVPRAGVPPGR